MKYLQTFESYKQPSVYVAPKGKVVYRATTSKNENNNWYAFNKNDATGYLVHGGKIVSKKIGGLKFIYADEVEDTLGYYYDEIVELYPELFEMDEYNTPRLPNDYSRVKYWESIKSFLMNKGYSGIFTNNKLSLDYEVYIF